MTKNKMSWFWAAIFVSASLLFASNTCESDVEVLSTQSPPPDLEALQSEARYDPAAMLEQRHLGASAQAASCQAQGTKYKHGQKIWRPDPCETCLCLDGETFCWWQQCDVTNQDGLPRDHNEVALPVQQPGQSEHGVLGQSEHRGGQDGGEHDSDNEHGHENGHENGHEELSRENVTNAEMDEYEQTEITHRDYDTTYQSSTTDPTTIDHTSSTVDAANSNPAGFPNASDWSTTSGDDVSTHADSDWPPMMANEKAPSYKTETEQTRQTKQSQVCTVLGVEYAVGAVLPRATGNCLRCICAAGVTSSPVNTTSSITSSSSPNSPRLTSSSASPRVTCQPHDCAPLTRSDMLDDSASNIF